MLGMIQEWYNHIALHVVNMQIPLSKVMIAGILTDMHIKIKVLMILLAVLIIAAPVSIMYYNARRSVKNNTVATCRCPC